MQKDIFISHASEDKLDVARPLAKLLQNRGLSVWLDEQELTLGDSLRRSIDIGLRGAKFGVVILSPSFFAKEWPMRELDALVALEDAGRKVVLPVWHEIEREAILGFSPTLADKVGISTMKGLDVVAIEIVKAIGSKAYISSTSDGQGVERPTSITHNPHAKYVGTLIDFFTDVADDKPLDIEIAADHTGKVVLFYNRPLAVHLQRIEYFLGEKCLVFLSDRNHRRDAGLPISDVVTQLIKGSRKILLVRLSDDLQPLDEFELPFRVYE